MWLSFYVPDGLWAYGLFFALSAFNGSKKAYLLSVCAGVVWELLQKFDVCYGTFDWFDILMYILASLIAFIILLIWRKKL